jgi:hypothetical protein
MDQEPKLPFLHGLTVLTGILIAGGLILLLGIVVMLNPPVNTNSPNQPIVLTVIPAPTATQFIPTPVVTTTPRVIDGITKGVFVQIEGTGGVGLRLRSGPGTDFPSRLLGMDAEVFQVKDGPKEADGFTWWYLEAPYDQNRSGWAASKYLAVVKQSQ